MITNTATVSAAEFDPNTANNTDAEDTNVTPEADLTIAKSDSPDAVDAGATLTYTLSVNNLGPSTATNVSVTDTLPMGVTFVSATGTGWTCNEASGTVTCTRPSLAMGLAPDITITVTAPSEGGTITNNVSVTAAEFDPNNANNSDSENTDVTPVADLSVAKADSPDPVNVSSALTYTLNVSNAGPSTAANVSVADTLPMGVTFVSASGTGWACNEAGGVVTCTRASLAPGAAPAITIDVTAPATAGTITNNVSLTSATNDPDAANNMASQDTTVQVMVDFDPELTDAADPVLAGENITYTASIMNPAAFDIPNLSMTITLDGTLVPGMTTPSQGTCGAPVANVITCDLGTLAGSGTATVTVVAMTTAASVPSVNSSATVSSPAVVDPNPGNDVAGETTTVNPAVDLSIVKSDSPDAVTAGNNLTYTLAVSNAGPSDATSVEVTDTLPAGVSFVSASGTGWSCGASMGVVTCTRATLAPGAAPDITLIVAVAPDTRGTLSNTASVSSAETDTNAGNNSDTADTAVNASADLAIVKTDSPDPVVEGANLTYTLAVMNNGPSSATNVSVTDTLPVGVTFVSAGGTGWTCNQSMGTVTCTRATLAPGAAPDITIVVMPPTAGSISNTASITATETDGVAANNSSTAMTTVNPAITPDFDLVLTPPTFNVPAGLAATYTLTVSSVGGFAGTVQLGCMVEPGGPVCSVSQSSVNLASGGSATATVSVITRAGSGSAGPPPGRVPPMNGWRVLTWSLLMLSLGLFFALAQAMRRRAWRGAVARLAAVVLLCVMAYGCATVGQRTASGDYSVVVRGTSGSLTHTTTAVLQVR
jgi:uncharacterized repeat protein (TIGR01451 family)